MGINLFFSNDINKLLNMFLNQIHNETHNRLDKNAFIPITILYPNSNVKKWLQLEIAKAHSIAINLNFQYLEEGLSSLLNKINDKAGIDEDSLLFLGHKKNHIYLELVILDIILQMDSQKDNNMIKSYLELDEGINRINKAWQLCVILAKNFREYEYHREKMIDKWHNEQLYTTKIQFKEIEKIQREIYKKIFIDKSYSAKIKKIADGKDITTLPQFIKNFFVKKEINNDIVKPSIYIFGFSQISKFHYGLLELLKSHYEIKIFQFNFYPGINNQTIIDKQVQTNSIIKQWGLPLKDNNTILSEIVKKNKNDVNITISNFSVQKKEAKSLLKRLQNSIRETEEPIKTENQDVSLQIVGCPGIKREVEVVYNSILYNLQTDDTLTLNDIVVLVPNIAKYKSVIESVFGLNPNKKEYIDETTKNNLFIPYNISDSSAKDDSVFANALLSGLQLTKGNFNRKEVFDFIFNPCVLEARGISHSTALIWLNWADALNIYHSYDQQDNKNESFINSPWWTWEMALKRLRLGRIMSIEQDKQKDFMNILPFSDMDSESQDILDAFVSFIEELFDIIKKLSINQNAKEWKKNLTLFLHKFLKIPETLKEESFVYNALLSKIEEVSLFELVFGNKEFDFEYILQYLISGIKGISSSHGKYLVDGVTISSLSPMRPIPFKIVYIIGLNEREFPGNSDRSTLDLRNDKKELGDVSRVEANNYLFLETLLTVKDKLYLTYISEDTQKDKKFYPSSVCVQLINFINEHLLTNPYRIIEAPLKGESLKYFQQNTMEEYSDILNVNYFYSDNLLALITLLKEKQVLLTKEHTKIIKKHLNKAYKNFILTMDSSTTKNINQPTQVTIEDLKNLIINPFDKKLKKLLHIYDEEDINEKLLREEEPFVIEFLTGYSLKTSSIEGKIKEILNNSSPISFETKYNLIKLSGNSPEGVYETITKSNLKKTIETQQDDLMNILSRFKTRLIKFYEKINITDLSSRNDTNINRIAPPIIKTPNHEVKIIGTINNLIITKDNNNQWANFIVITTAKKKKELPKYVILPVLTFILLDMLSKKNKLDNIEYSADMHKRIVISYIDGIDILEYMTPDWGNNGEEKYFEYLIEMLFNHSSFEFLPFKIISETYLSKSEELTNLGASKKMQQKYYKILTKKIADSLSNSYRYDIQLDNFQQMINSPSFVPKNALEIIMEIYLPFCNILPMDEE